MLKTNIKILEEITENNPENNYNLINEKQKFNSNVYIRFIIEINKETI